LDRHSIISIAVIIIVVLLALNYLNAECNIGGESKRVRSSTRTEQGAARQVENQGIETQAVDPFDPMKEKEESEPDDHSPFIPPTPPPGPPGP
jgi:hypothetical protein